MQGANTPLSVCGEIAGDPLFVPAAGERRVEEGRDDALGLFDAFLELIAYFEQHQEQLDEDARRRLYTNALRILDSKNPALQDICAAAPKLIDYLGAESLAHFAGVQQILRDAGLPFTIIPRLARALCYYNLAVF